jgi:YHS domain-containing protein
MKKYISIIIATAAGLFSSCTSTDVTSTPTAKGVKPYTAQTCIVSGNKLGSMGTPVTEAYNGQEIKFCCKPCVKKFHASPEKYMANMKH